MWPSFGSRPNMRPYDAITPTVVPFGDPSAPVNPPTAPMAAESARWDFSKGDDQPEVALNRAIWKSIKGRDSTMPRPRHELIVGTVPNDEEAQNAERADR
jgi:hypothetical protein